MSIDMPIDEALRRLENMPTDYRMYMGDIMALEMAKQSLEAWCKIESELKAYAEKLASESQYDSRVEAVLHCLNVMRKHIKEDSDGQA